MDQSLCTFYLLVRRSYGTDDIACLDNEFPLVLVKARITPDPSTPRVEVLPKSMLSK
jgi:hypothetical protein